MVMCVSVPLSVVQLCTDNYYGVGVNALFDTAAGHAVSHLMTVLMALRVIISLVRPSPTHTSGSPSAIAAMRLQFIHTTT